MENTLRQKACFSLGKSMILGPKIAQDRFFAIFTVKTAKLAKFACWAQKCDFYGKLAFLGSEALISCPSRQPCSRQWFLWCFGARFHHFRTFRSFSHFFLQKRLLSQKAVLGAKVRVFALLGPFWGHFCTPPRTLL